MENIKIWVGEMPGYKLLDCGEKQKLEEVGGVRIVRNEPRAWWKKSLPEEEWKGTKTELETVVDIFDGIKAKIKFKETSKHIGIFPEQMGEWRWVADKIKNKEINVLNLFGYTGIATLVAAKNGARVTHVDASKQSIDWARENQKLSGLQNAPIRWILDDAVKFMKKETKRGEKYDAIIMDPPSFGRGPKGEVWKIEEKLPGLLAACREVLSDNPLFVIFNMYSTELSSISVANLLADMIPHQSVQDGHIECGELAIKQEGSERLLPMSIFALWCAK